MTEEQAIKVLLMIETHGGLAFKAKEIAIKDIKDVKEIKEIMECDADAETKCKMISYILTAKPHYFEEQKSYEDAISRQEVLGILARYEDFEDLASVLIKVIKELPPVKPQEKTGHWILGICDNCEYDWGKDAPIASVPNFCPNCGRYMFVPQESEDKE